MTGCMNAQQETNQKEEVQKEETTMKCWIDEEEVEIEWEDNASVRALQEMTKSSALTIEMGMYGGFEQVGQLPDALPSEDRQMDTKPGDIVLYASDQIVFFYGQHAWSYTRLGQIRNKSEADLQQLLGNRDVVITIKQE